MKWHTSVDLLAHACVPNLNISSFFSSTCFLHYYHEMTEISECNSISLKSCTSIPVFSATHQWKKENWFTDGIELGFLTKLFNRNNITKPPVSFSAVLFNDLFRCPYFTSSAELDLWRETGENSIKHLISPFHRLIWAVFEIFWVKNLNELVNWFDTPRICSVSPCQVWTLQCWFWHSWLC